MPVIGAVLYLDEDPAYHEGVLRLLEHDPRVTLGQEHGQRLPVVLESESRNEEKSLWNEIQALPGITFCSVVYADFSDLNLEETA